MGPCAGLAARAWWCCCCCRRSEADVCMFPLTWWHRHVSCLQAGGKPEAALRDGVGGQVLRPELGKHALSQLAVARAVLKGLVRVPQAAQRLCGDHDRPLVDAPVAPHQVCAGCRPCIVDALLRWPPAAPRASFGEQLAGDSRRLGSSRRARHSARCRRAGAVSRAMDVLHDGSLQTRSGADALAVCEHTYINRRNRVMHRSSCSLWLKLAARWQARCLSCSKHMAAGWRVNQRCTAKGLGSCRFW